MRSRNVTAEKILNALFDFVSDFIQITFDYILEFQYVNDFTYNFLGNNIFYNEITSLVIVC